MLRHLFRPLFLCLPPSLCPCSGSGSLALPWSVVLVWPPSHLFSKPGSVSQLPALFSSFRDPSSQTGRFAHKLSNLRVAV